jgi:hypothetical protein
MASPRALVEIEQSDHFHFCDAIPLLHRFHESNVRPTQLRPTRPLAELLPEPRMHSIVRGLVTAFFQSALDPGREDPVAQFGDAELREFDPAVRRLSQEIAGREA